MNKFLIAFIKLFLFGSGFMIFVLQTPTVERQIAVYITGFILMVTAIFIDMEVEEDDGEF